MENITADSDAIHQQLLNAASDVASPPALLRLRQLRAKDAAIASSQRDAQRNYQPSRVARKPQRSASLTLLNSLRPHFCIHRRTNNNNNNNNKKLIYIAP